MHVGGANPIGNQANFQFHPRIVIRWRCNRICTIHALFGVLILRNFKLDVLAGQRRDGLTVLEAQRHLLDVMGEVADAFDPCDELPDREQLLGNDDGDIRLHLELAGESDLLFFLILADEGQLGGQILSASLDYANLAQAAGAPSAAGRRNEHAFLVQCLEQRLAAFHLKLLRSIIDGNPDDSVVADGGIGDDHQEGKEHRDETDDSDAYQKGDDHTLLLMIRRSCRRSP